ncbi:cysteine desulfurase family protein [Fictibacillus terranigra]|uniref:cysteine desulfurase n=1 Tax=Fictibacillus terranigra TaxID=3058424 RepID=A0ABT8E4D3_9BACL|nr:cysteine desulfurase family protein [Fictibacillus sp. CENA-BCM004]MDN4072773.1 cysteine desulfurase family protein [Fictibacillus sp. CENA-BCM004]
MDRIYVDHAATSPIHPDVVQEMLPYFTEHFGNPSSIHQFGRKTRQLLDEARVTAAKSIGAQPSHIMFTSGGTEADNAAIFGTAYANSGQGKHIISTQIEHHAVLHACEELQRQGFEVTFLPVDEAGRISIQALKETLREDTILVSIMYGNNEVGTIQDIQTIGEILKEHQAYFHTDAVQAYGVLPLNVQELQVDLLSVSGHKINGPKGTGFLYIGDGVSIAPSFFGGEQERKRRAGTENVAGIAGFAKAIAIMAEEGHQRAEKYEGFKKTMLSIFKEEGIEYLLNGSAEHSLPHILNVSFPGVKTEVLLVNLDLAGIAASSGSACTAGSIEPSHVLTAMFGKTDRTKNAVRFSFGLYNTQEQIEKTARETAKIVKRLQK